ncbi:hypothetical protein B0H11DRAFT_2376815 [Mycena galericulata]|nr:hypothetical protein B0H11DRAFT_2376815 [Mycena galericulata]
MVPSRAPTAEQVWGTTSPPPPTADGHRRRKAAHHAQWGPVTGASMPRAPHRQFPAAGSRRVVTPAPKPEPIVIYFALYPLPMLFNGLLSDPEHADLYPRSSRLFNATSFYLHAADNQLTFEFTVPESDPPDPSHSFYAEFNTWLTDKMKTRNLYFSPPPAHVTQPLVSAQMHTPAWHTMQFLSFDWTVVNVGNKPRAGQEDAGRILTASPFPWHEFSITGFKAFKSASNNPSTVGGVYYIIAPKYSPILGQPKEIAGLHRCFPLRILDPLSPHYDPTDPAVCYSDCEVTAPSSAAAPSASGSSRHHAPAVRQREFQAAMDSDEEEEFMQEALKRSMVDAPNAAGPSRPLPRPPPGVRSHSSEPPAFRSIRRRLNNNSPAIDLTRSPSPEIRCPTFRSVAGWAQSLEAVLSATASRVHGPTTTLLVEGLLAHITSFFGGEPYRAQNAEDTVSIQPADRYGLLARTATYTIGDSVGQGMRQNAMTELMNLVFSDARVWRKIGNGHVIDMVPTCIDPDADRLRRIKAYGYACMLHVVLEHSLPIPLSTLFAFAVLQPDGDVVVLEDPTLLRATSPAEFLVLQQWPQKLGDFQDRKDDENLKALTTEYFNKMPEILGTLISPDSFKGYTTILYRLVLFGSTIPFAKSPDIMAFAEGFNSNLNASYRFTLGQSLGGSARSLLLLMSAARVKTAQEVIDRLNWISVDLDAPALRPVEEKYKTALIRYLRGKGIVQHHLLHASSLTDEERSIEPDDPCARAVMFLMTITGTQQLPKDDGTIDMTFVARFDTGEGNQERMRMSSPLRNPESWPDYLYPVRAHTCFDGVDLPLHEIEDLLAQPLPVDNTCTDFDLYQYLMWRPVTRFAEFGGLVSF